MALTKEDLGAIAELLDQKLEEKLEQKLEEKLEQKLEQKLEEKFEQKLEPIYQRLDGINQRLDNVDRRLERLERKVDNGFMAIGRVIDDLAGITGEKTARLEEDVETLKQANKFRVVEIRELQAQ